jgi:O-antigen ligase/tetratricopeptide (TPR) repeat protein
VARLLLAAHLLLSPLVFSSHVIESFETGKAVVLLCTGASLLALLILDGPHWWGSLRTEKLDVAVLLLLSSGVLSTLLSMSPRTSLVGAQDSFSGLLTQLALGSLYLASRVWLRDTAQWRRLLGAPVAAAGLSAGYALMQVGGLDPFEWTHTSEAPGGGLRAFSTLGQPNTLAAYLAMTLPLALHFARHATRPIARLPSALVAVAVVGTIIASTSRSGWLALGAVLAFMLLRRGPEGRGHARTAGATLALAVAFLVVLSWLPARSPFWESLARRVEKLGDAGARPALWNAALQMTRQHPVFGVGVDCFRLAFPAVRPVGHDLVDWNRWPVKAHNDLLHMAATQGLLGAIAAVLLVGGFVLSGRRALREEEGVEQSLAGACLAGGLAWGITGAFGFTVIPTSVLMVAFAARLAPRTVADRPEPPLSNAPAASPLRVVLALGLVLVTVLATARWLQAEVVGARGYDQLVAQPLEAVQDLTRAVAIDPGRDTLWAGLGYAHRQAAMTAPDAASYRYHLEEAQAALRRAASIAPRDPRYPGELCALSPSLAREGQATREASFHLCDDALLGDPRNVPLLLAAGRGALRLDAPDRTQALGQRALELHPNLGQALHLLGRVALQKEPERALQLLRASVRAEWHGDDAAFALAATDLARVLLRLGHPDQAERTARATLAEHPRAVDARLALAESLELQSRLAEAVSEYRLVLAARPGDPLAQQALARLTIRTR